MARERIKSGPATVTVGGGLDSYVRRLTAELPDAVAEAVMEATSPMVSRAINRWPVKTGRSKLGIRMQAIKGPQGEPTAQVRIFNDVRYTRWIRQRGYDEMRTWVRLIHAPALRLAPTIYRRAFTALIKGVLRGSR